MRDMPDSDPLNLPTTSVLVRLRLLTEDARRRTHDTSEAGRHLALIALDGACEYALWLASREHTVLIKQRAGIPELYSALKPALPSWEIRGWPGVSQMHQARNVAQHAGVAHDVSQLPNWADATIAFIDSLCLAAFGTQLTEIVLADAVEDPSIHTQLRWSEEQLAENPGQSFSLAVGAFDTARARWREQRDAPVFAPSPDGFQPVPSFASPLQDVDDFLEVQPFASDPGEYAWLRRARREHEHAGWLPNPEEARRALLFITGWIVRWEIFDRGYPVDRWDAHREGIEPPITGDGTTLEILGAHVEFLPDLPGRPARNVIRLALANVPSRGRSPWDISLRDALTECSRDAGHGGVFLEVHWAMSGTLVLEVALDADANVVADVAERAVKLAAERHQAQLAASAERERERQQLETELRALVASARSDDLALFGDVIVVVDEWLGTSGWLAFLEIYVGGRAQEELLQTHNIFGNQRAAFPNLHVRDGKVTFSVSAMTADLDHALRTAIADSEDQARHVRKIRTQQTQAFQTFTAGFQRHFGPLPES
jgi:hypothetical protein